MFIFLSVHRAAEGVVICLGGGEGHVCIPLPCKEHLSENADILQYLQFRQNYVFLGYLITLYYYYCYYYYIGICLAPNWFWPSLYTSLAFFALCKNVH